MTGVFSSSLGWVRNRTPVSTTPPEGFSPDPRRRNAAELIDRWGLWIAPVLIAGLAGLLALYHRSLDLDNAVMQQRSALLSLLSFLLTTGGRCAILYYPCYPLP